MYVQLFPVKHFSQIKTNFLLAVFFVTFVGIQCTKKHITGQLPKSDDLNDVSDSFSHHFRDGSGYAEDPYIIYNEDDLYGIISGTSTQINHYRLANDIVLTKSQRMLPLKSISFISLEGDNFTISNVYFKTTQTHAGIFSQLFDSHIQNLTIDNVDIDGQIYAGVLIGSSYQVQLTQIRTSNVKIKGSAGVGGIVAITQNTKITNSKTAGQLIVMERTAGGIVGGAYGITHIENCSTTMSIDASKANITWLVPVSIGGIIGRVQTDRSGINVIRNNFANNLKIIGQPNAVSTTQVGYPGFKRILGAISVPEFSSQIPIVWLENNYANGAIEMRTAKGDIVEISDLNGMELGHAQLHGGTVYQ